MDFKDFIFQYWQIILSGVLALFSIIAIFIKKKPSCDLLSKVLNTVITKLPDLIVQAEVPGNGIEKKLKVITLGLDLFEKELSRKLSNDEVIYFSSILSNEIESILSTPQKKGE